ncbi:MAG: hypothetical protein U1G08_07790 [Verrucomicrobiota bacterium]
MNPDLCDWIGLDYSTCSESLGANSDALRITNLADVLAARWKQTYERLTPHPSNIYRIAFGTFQYLYDDYATLEALGKVPLNPAYEPRLVAAMGVTRPQKTERDDQRLRGWVGPTERMFGRQFDKGHFIAHSIGGAVDQCELNVFVQSRALNRGWSADGKRYRLMEKYCHENGGTFCFSRPLYRDGTAMPGWIEFGILRSDGQWWVERFPN